MCCAYKGTYILRKCLMMCIQWEKNLYTRETTILCIQGKSPLYTRETPHAGHTREEPPFIPGKCIILCIQGNSPLYTRETPHTGHTREEPPIYQGNTSYCEYKGYKGKAYISSPCILGKHLILCIQGNSPLYTTETPHTGHTKEKLPIY